MLIWVAPASRGSPVVAGNRHMPARCRRYAVWFQRSHHFSRTDGSGAYLNRAVVLRHPNESLKPVSMNTERNTFMHLAADVS
ncbi:MAG: hypothetical protein DMG83_03370 [Acidobacteria bacterium]|nr:MAG: hypothetical protein DMG83_03370 [Acidobacteriota bacterium]